MLDCIWNSFFIQFSELQAFPRVHTILFGDPLLFTYIFISLLINYDVSTTAIKKRTSDLCCFWSIDLLSSGSPEFRSITQRTAEKLIAP
jgi:uncharacterized membrane protein